MKHPPLNYSTRGPSSYPNNGAFGALRDGSLYEQEQDKARTSIQGSLKRGQRVMISIVPVTRSPCHQSLLKVPFNLVVFVLRRFSRRAVQTSRAQAVRRIFVGQKNQEPPVPPQRRQTSQTNEEMTRNKEMTVRKKERGKLSTVFPVPQPPLPSLSRGPINRTAAGNNRNEQYWAMDRLGEVGNFICRVAVGADPKGGDRFLARRTNNRRTQVHAAPFPFLSRNP